MRRGFSLVELSIVLVILGLLVGGVLTAQSLIRAAELRAITTEFDHYRAATMVFQDKYFSVPGDMPNATLFWGRMTTTSCSGSSAIIDSGTCDGNNDRILWGASAAGLSAELFQYWRQLALEGLIQGTYSGVSGSAGTFDFVPGVNVATSRFGSAGWGIWTANATAGNTQQYARTANNHMVIFGNYITNAYPGGPALTPVEAWNIDVKMDDGLPGTGKLTAHRRDICTNSSSPSDFTSGYKLESSAVACALFFINGFYSS